MKLWEGKRYQEAIPPLEDALRIAIAERNTFGERQCRMVLGLCYYELKDYSKTVEHFERCLAVDKATETETNVSIDLYWLGLAYRELKNYEKAIEFAEMALDLSRSMKDKKEIKSAYEMLFGIATEMGDRPKQILFTQRALDEFRAMGERKTELELLTKLARVYLSAGDNRRALATVNICSELCDRQGDEEHRSELLSVMADLQAALGDNQTAVSYLKKRLAYQIATPTADHQYSLPMTYYSLGWQYLALGDYKQAVAMGELGMKSLERVDPALRGVSEETNGQALSILLTIGYALAGEPDRGEQFLRPGLHGIWRSLFYLIANNPKKAMAEVPRGDITTMPEEEEAAESLVTVTGIYTIFGRCYEALGETEKALKHYRRAIMIIERQREVLGPDQQAGFMTAQQYPPLNNYTPYEGLMRIASPEEGFTTSEAAKARLLLAQISSRYGSEGADIPSDVRSREREVKLRLANLNSRFEAAFKQGDTRGIVEAQAKANEGRKDLALMVERLRRDYPEYTAINYPQPLRLSEIALRPREVLIEYAVTDSRTMGWMVKDGKVVKSIVADISRGELDALIELQRRQISNISDLPSFEYNAKVGSKLYKLLMKDFLPLVGRGDAIIIVPDKKLGLLPFETLITSDPAKVIVVQGRHGAAPANISYLGDDYAISYYQSASTLTMMRNLRKQNDFTKAIFVLSDPIYEAGDFRLKGRSVSSHSVEGEKLMRAVEDGSGLVLARLDKTGGLARELLSLFKDEPCDQVSGLEASEAEIRKRDLTRYHYLVFATHGILDSRVAGIMEPALVLSQVGNGAGENGLLTLTKVMGMRLSCDVAALTACETGNGRLVSGEGVMGLGRAFQYAGARSVLASLWSVSEESTVRLMARFFSYQKAGKDRITAIKMARDDIRKEGYEHPFYWAPFILMGEPR